MKSHHHSTPLHAVMVMALLACGCYSTGLDSVTIVPSPIATPVGIIWVANEIDGVATTLVPPDLVFEDDRRFHGSSGCNRYFAELNPTTPMVRVGQVGTTRMTCDPPLMEQEHRFVNVLQSVTRSQVDGGTLLFRDTTGRVRIRFTRVNATGSR
jgi:heat shock protein HslJ